MRSTRPRTRAGMSSSIAELMAAYSPPMPAPVKKRQTKNHIGFFENAVSDRRDQVDRQRHHEELLAAEPVGEVAEEQRAQAGAGDVDAGRDTDLALGDRDAAALLGQPAGDRADDRHLEPVEDPDGAEPDHDQPVPPRPRQPVHPGRDVGRDLACLTPLICGLLRIVLRRTERAQRTRAVVPGGSPPETWRQRRATGLRRDDAGPGVSLTGRTTTRSCRSEEVSSRAAPSAAVDVPQHGGSATWSRRLRSPARWWRASSPGTSAEEAVAATRHLADKGLLAVAGPPRRGHRRRAARPTATRDAYLALLELLGRRRPDRPAPRSRSSSQRSGRRCPATARRSRSTTRGRSARRRTRAGTTVTLDMEDHTTTDSTLGILRELRADFPEHRAPCCRPTCTAPRPTARTCATPARGCACARAPTRSRSRWPTRASARSTGLRALPEGADGRRGLPDGRDPRPAPDRHRRGARAPRRTARTDSYEYQMLYGIRPHEQERLAATGETDAGLRARTATSGTAISSDGWPREPANLALFLRSTLTKG